MLFKIEHREQISFSLLDIERWKQKTVKRDFKR